MNSLLKLSCVLALALGLACPLSAVSAPADSGRLPNSICANLNQRFPGWKLALPDPLLASIVNQTTRATAEDLCIAAADFDGNGRTDYAVFIRIGRSQYDTRLIMFLRKGRGYRHRTLHRGAPAGEMYLTISPQGSAGTDYGRDQRIVYRLPTLQIQSEVGGTGFVYERGRFRSVVTGD